MIVLASIAFTVRVPPWGISPQGVLREIPEHLFYAFTSTTTGNRLGRNCVATRCPACFSSLFLKQAEGLPQQDHQVGRLGLEGARLREQQKSRMIFPDAWTL